MTFSFKLPYVNPTQPGEQGCSALIITMVRDNLLNAIKLKLKCKKKKKTQPANKPAGNPEVIQPLNLIILKRTSANSGQWTKTTKTLRKVTFFSFLIISLKPSHIFKIAESRNSQGRLKGG